MLTQLLNMSSLAPFLLKNIPIAHHGHPLGQWPRTSIESRELGGKTLGLLGFGVIGKKFLD